MTSRTQNSFLNLLNSCILEDFSEADNLIGSLENRGQFPTWKIERKEITFPRQLVERVPWHFLWKTCLPSKHFLQRVGMTFRHLTPCPNYCSGKLPPVFFKVLLLWKFFAKKAKFSRQNCWKFCPCGNRALSTLVMMIGRFYHQWTMFVEVL